MAFTDTPISFQCGFKGVELVWHSPQPDCGDPAPMGVAGTQRSDPWPVTGLRAHTIEICELGFWA